MPLTANSGPHAGKRTEKALKVWEAASSRIITATFIITKQKVNMNVVLCYTSTNDKDESVKKGFNITFQSMKLKKLQYYNMEEAPRDYKSFV